MNKNYEEMYNSIKVSDNEKEHMKRIMEQELKKNTNRSKSVTYKNAGRVLKTVAACAAALAVVVAGTGVYTVRAETSYITVESGAEVGLSVNRWNKVIKAEAKNAIAEDMLKEIDVKGCNYDEAVGNILNYEQKHGYISDSNNLTISVSCNNEKNACNMQQKIDEKCSQGEYHKYGQTKVNDCGSANNGANSDTAHEGEHEKGTNDNGHVEGNHNAGENNANENHDGDGLHNGTGNGIGNGYGTGNRDGNGKGAGAK